MVLALSRLCVMTAIGLKASAAVPAEKTTKPHDCTSDNLPYQVVEVYDGNDKGSYQLISWDWSSGERSALWSLPKDKYPNISLLDACGLNPKDNIVYCKVTFEIFTKFRTFRDYLVRVDGKGFAYVAEMMMCDGGAFDEAGTYWSNLGQRIFKFEAVHELKGWTEPHRDLPELPEVGKTIPKHGDDIVVWRDHLISIDKGQVIFTDLSDPNLRTYEAKPNPSVALHSTPFESAFLYGENIYFSTSLDGSVIKIEPDFQARSFIGTDIGAKRKAIGADSNGLDGLNCILTESPAEVAEVPKDAGLRPPTFGAPLAALALILTLDIGRGLV